ncbi:helix-turn-helix domain-containing protein [Limosilactobacillus oris]|uniref:helix-turn-helix domain-containing protein n=1 Tax=Limosilactobacillus oris TaxID=1632 RepID=UPI0024B91FB6|nr:helix-turn-helix transcriptional regulator [Limosilactobacillus oris]
MSKNEKPHNRIAELRKGKGLTLQQVADAIGVGNNTISRYETGKREPKLETWLKLADFFDVPVTYLQGFDVSKIVSKSNVYGQSLMRILDFENNKTNLTNAEQDELTIAIGNLLGFITNILPYANANCDSETRKKNLKEFYKLIGNLSYVLLGKKPLISSGVPTFCPGNQKELLQVLNKINGLFVD